MIGLDRFRTVERPGLSAPSRGVRPRGLPDAYTPVAGDPGLQTYLWLGGHLGDGAAVTAGNGHGELELTKFHSPAATTAEPNAPANTMGLRRIMFAVDDIEDAVARLRAHGAELVGEVAQYEDSYRLCYVRGPAGIIVALAEQLS